MVGGIEHLSFASVHEDVRCIVGKVEKIVEDWFLLNNVYIHGTDLDRSEISSGGKLYVLQGTFPCLSLDQSGPIRLDDEGNIHGPWMIDCQLKEGCC